MPLTITLLGTGTSAGVPMIGCTCDVCTSADPRDHRDRPSAMVRYADPRGIERTFVIDTSPELRYQMIRHRVMRLDGVLYTHAHADHIFGLDDLRRFNAVMEQPIDIYAEARVLADLRRVFSYVFEPRKNPNPSFVASLIPFTIRPDEPITLHGRAWLPVRLMHGRLPIVGYRVGAFAYCTDVSSLPPEAYDSLAGLDVLVIDALRYRHHPTHMTVDQALAVIDELQPRRAYLTHISHDIRHADLEARLPGHVFLGYDGLTIEVEA